MLNTKPKIKLLFVGVLGSASTATHRLEAIERLGYSVSSIDTNQYFDSSKFIVSRLRDRFHIGRQVNLFNEQVLDAVKQFKPHIAWFDKSIHLFPRTVSKIRECGVYTVHHNQDNPFSKWKGLPLWKCFIKAIPEFDLHLVPRTVNLSEYLAVGARDIYLMPFGYDPKSQFPPPAGWSDANRTYDVTFMGFPYAGRAELFTELYRNYQIRVNLWGDYRWKRHLPSDVYAQIYRGPNRTFEEYRETFWRSRICLGFVTHENFDEIGHRSLEITACGGFLLAEDVPGHRAYFIDGHEAIFFNSAADCAEKIRHYLPDELERAKIAYGGLKRSQDSKYSNDCRLEMALRYINTKISFANPAD